MKKWKKIGIGVLLGAMSFTALYYGALISLPNVIDLNKYKESVSQAIEKETGFKLACEDISFKKSLNPYLKINMYHTLVLYPNDEVFLKLKEVDLKVKILPLLFKKIVIKDAKLTRPIINITLYKDFSTSLEKYIDINKTINTNGYNFDSLISDTLCERYKIKFNDETTGKVFYLEGDELLLKNLKLNDKAHVALKGAVYEGKTEYIKYDINVISSLNRDKKQFSFSPFKPLLGSGLKANIYGHLVVDKQNNINGNLKVSDLSLILDNVRLSGNEANLTFKGQEVDIDTKFHTSPTDSANISGKLSFGNKKYVNLNTRAKNVNLENLFKIVSEVTEILNVQNPFSGAKLKGFLDADFNLNSDFKKLKSNGTAKIEKAVISHTSLPYSITNINANVNFDNNKINIEKATAEVNNTPIEITGVINEDVSYNIKASSQNLDLKNIVSIFDLKKYIPFNIQKGILSFESDISGILNKTSDLNTLINVLNLKFNDEKSKTNVKMDSLNLIFKGNEKKYDGEITCNNVDLTKSNQNIKTDSFKLSFDDKKILIPNNKITSLNGLEIYGSIADYRKNPIGNISFTGSVDSKYIAKLIANQIKLPYKAMGVIDTNGKITFSKNGLNIKSQLKTNNENYLSYVVIQELLGKPTLFDLDIDVLPSEIKINDVSIYENSSPKVDAKNKLLNLDGSLLLNNSPIMKNVKVLIPQPISFATNFMGGENISLSANLLLNKSIDKPEIKGDAKIYKYDIKKYLTSIHNADVSLTADNIRVVAPDIIVNDSSFNCVADIEPSSSIQNIVVSNMQLNSLNLDLNSLFSLFENDDTFGKNSKITVKKGSATINKFKILDLKARDISSDIELEDNVLKLSNVNAQAYGGVIEGTLKYLFNQNELMASITGKNVYIKDALFDLCKIDDNLEGKADFGAKFSLKTGEEKASLQSLTGNMQFNASNGKMGTLGKFEYYLYAQNLFYHGLLNATLNRIADALIHNNTMHFRNASGNIFFQNGYIIAEEIQTKGDDMSLYLQGRHNMLSNQSNINIYGRISDEIKNKLGSFGNISISEVMNSKAKKKYTNVSVQNDRIMKKIPELYMQPEAKTNTFKVNIYGDLNSLNAINSFEWIISNEEMQENNLPDFSDINSDL